MRRLISIAALSMVAQGLSGCSGGGVVATENDRLRAQVLDLENQIKTLTGRNAELQTQLTASAKVPTSVPADILANTPRVTGIAINRLSQAVDEDGDGIPESIILYVEPADGLGRFLQVVGSVSMHAAILPADAPAKTIGQVTLGPAAVREGYRSAFTGQYYSFTLPIAAPPLPPPNPLPPIATATQPAQPAAPADGPELFSQCTVRVEFTDGYTGQKFAAERVIDLR